MAAADNLGRATGVSGPARSERAKAGKIRIASILRSILGILAAEVLQLAWSSIKPSWFTFFALRQTCTSIKTGELCSLIFLKLGACSYLWMVVKCRVTVPPF